MPEVNDTEPMGVVEKSLEFKVLKYKIKEVSCCESQNQGAMQNLEGQGKWSC